MFLHNKKLIYYLFVAPFYCGRLFNFIMSFFSNIVNFCAVLNDIYDNIMKVIKANKISTERIIAHKTDEIFLCKNFAIHTIVIGVQYIGFIYQ